MTANITLPNKSKHLFQISLHDSMSPKHETGLDASFFDDLFPFTSI